MLKNNEGVTIMDVMIVLCVFGIITLIGLSSCEINMNPELTIEEKMKQNRENIAKYKKEQEAIQAENLKKENKYKINTEEYYTEESTESKQVKERKYLFSKEKTEEEGYVKIRKRSF